MVDLTTAKDRRFPVPGFNVQVRWQGSGTVLVGQTGATYSVDLTTGLVTPVAGGWSLSDVATDPLGGDSLVELASSGGSIFREWSLGGGPPYRTTVLDQRGFAPMPSGSGTGRPGETAIWSRAWVTSPVWHPWSLWSTCGPVC